MLENSSSIFFIKYYLKILGLKIICSVDELLVKTHSETVQECLLSAEDHTLISTAIIQVHKISLIAGQTRLAQNHTKDKG